MKRGRVLVTRPEGQAAATMAALAARGFDCVAAPATVFENLPGPPLDLAGIAGIAVTSANGVAALAARMARRDLPLFAVGEATATAARTAGFATVTAAAGDGASLARLIAGVAPVCETILYAAPEDAAVDLAALLPDHTVRRTVLYRMAPARSLPAEALAALDDGTILAALFYSVRTAQHFGQLVSQANRLPGLQGVAALCLSEPIAAAARALPFSAARAAVRPDEAALFDLLEALRAEG